MTGLRQGLLEGHRCQILCAPTGSGKTLAAAALIHDALKKDTRCAFVCDLRELVSQTSQRFFEYGIPHGVVMAKSTRGLMYPVQVCSAQTLEKRGFWPDLGLVSSTKRTLSVRRHQIHPEHRQAGGGADRHTFFQGLG